MVVKLAAYVAIVFFSILGLGLGRQAVAGAKVDVAEGSGALASLTVAALSVRVARRLDRITFLKFVAIVGVALAAVVGAVAHEEGTIGHAPMVLGAGGALAALIAGIELLRYQRMADPVPDVLRGRFPESNLFERAGIQMAATVDAEEIAPGGVAIVQVHLQNCWDGPRRVKVGLSPERSFFRGHGSVSAAAAMEIELAACEVGYIELGCRASDDARGNFALWLQVRVRGSEGERVRRRRVRELSVRWPWWFTILSLPAMHFVYGGGARLRVRVAGERVLAASHAAEGRWVSTWRRPT